MNVEGGGISMSAPSIGPAISSPSFGGFSAPSMDIGLIMSGPSFSFVNEGPAPIGSFEGFSLLMPATPDLGGTIGPIEALNSAFPITEPKPNFNIFNEGPVAPIFLENTRPFGLEDFSYNPGIKVEVITNPFLEQEETRNLVWETPSKIMRAIPRIIEIGIAQPLIEEEEDTQVQLEAVREQLRGLTAKVSKVPRSVQVVRPDQTTLFQEAVEKKVVYAIKEQEEGRTPSKEKISEKIELRQRKLIRDFKALARRLADARGAIESAFNQVQKNGKKAVSGEDVEQYVPSEYIDVRSGLLKKKSNENVPDGSYVLGKADIRKIKKTSSKEEMQAKVNEAIYVNGPVTESTSQDGEEATEEEVEKVYLFRKGRPPVRVVEMRVIKKKEMGASQTVDTGNRKTLEVPAEMEIAEESEEVKPLLKEVFKLVA